MAFLVRQKELLLHIQKNTSLLPFVTDIFDTAQTLINHLHIANSAIQKIPKEEISQNIQNLLPKIEFVQKGLEKLLQNKKGILSLLGAEKKQKILFLFQNKNEIRATGGFIGSIGILTIQNGRIENFEFRDVYDFDGQMEEFVHPPKEFAEISDRMFLRDANYSLDFPTSAQRILWFFEKEGGGKADTVIALDHTFLELALDIAGEVHVTDKITLTAQNVIPTLTYLIEGKFFGKGFDGNSPKKFLGDLAPALAEHTVKSLSLLNIEKILKNIDQKHLLAYSENADIQKIFQFLCIDGDIFKDFEKKNPQSIKDFFALSATNVGANKSDAYIEQNINQTSTLSLNGTIYSTLSLKRTHTWGASEELMFQDLYTKFKTSEMVGDEDMKKILGKGRNLVFFRIFLPPNIEIVSGKGLFSRNITVERLKTHTEVSFFFPEVSPGESEEISLSYILPEKLDSGKTLEFTALSQPGMTHQTLKKEFLWEEGVNVSLNTPILFDGIFLRDEDMTFERK